MPARSSYRSRVKERYKRLNIWEDFVNLRYRYAEFGLTPAQTFAAAMEEIERLYPDGKPESSGKPIPQKNKGLTPIMGEIKHDDHVRRLIKLCSGRDAAPLKVFTWVYNHAGIPWEDICPDDIPSPGAVYHLGKIKKDDKAYQKFLSEFAKLLPPRSQLEEAENRRTDDGRKVFTLLDQMERDLSHTKE